MLNKLLAFTSAFALGIFPAAAHSVAKHRAKPVSAVSSDFGTGPAPGPHRRKLTIPTPSALANLVNGTPWSNGRGLVTGATLQGIHTLEQQIFAGMGTWDQYGNYTPSISAASITGAQLAAGAAAVNLGFTPLNKAGDTMTGALTSSAEGTFHDLVVSAPSTAAPVFASVPQQNGITQLWTYDGTNSAAAYYANVNVTAGGNNGNNYLAGLVASATVIGAGSSVYGANLVCNLGSSLQYSSTVACNGTEIDVNNADATRGGRLYGNANRSIGLLINGSGVYENTAAMAVGGGTGTFTIWNYGLIFDQGTTTSAIQTATIMDYTYSATHDQDVGVHTDGAYYGGVYNFGAIVVAPSTIVANTFAFKSPSAYIDMTGFIDGSKIQSDGKLIAPNLPTTASGSIKGSACVDSAGNIYVKTTTGSCI